MARYARAHDPALKAVCPQCNRRRFIPLSTKPYCSNLCQREAENDNDEATTSEDGSNGTVEATGGTERLSSSD